MRLIDADKIEWYGCDYEDCNTCLENKKNCEICALANCSHNQVMKIPTVNAVVIPDNATNGDVIKATFPKVKFEEFHNCICARFFEDFYTGCFPLTWWYAPYKADKE